jgi:hypothetical protein
VEGTCGSVRRKRRLFEWRSKEAGVRAAGEGKEKRQKERGNNN